MRHILHHVRVPNSAMAEVEEAVPRPVSHEEDLQLAGPLQAALKVPQVGLTVLAQIRRLDLFICRVQWSGR